MSLRLFLTVVAICAAYPFGFTAAEPLFQHVHTFTGAPEGEDGTGLSLALTETHALVGSPRTKGRGAKVIARLYDAEATTLTAEIMTPDTPYRSDSYGTVTAMVGDRVLVCGKGSPNGPPEENIAWLYDLATGDRLVRFRDPTDVTGSEFGHDCALNDTHVLISAPRYDGAKEQSGAAYLFDAETGMLLHEFLPKTPQKGGTFGSRIVLSDRYAAIVQRFRTAEIGGPGAVYIYDLESGQMVRSFEKHEDDRGYVGAVALQGDLILIGHTYGRVDRRRTGRIDIFNIKTRAHVRRILPPGLPTNAFFGGNVVWSGDKILVGVTELRVGAEAYEGRALLFDATTGEHLQTFVRPVKDQVGIFPSRIAMAGGRILLSGLDDRMFLGGEAYLYEMRKP